MDIYLNKLELHGFKSFPEKTTVKFHKGITAVVGPNGCGKSNLVDALLWVLGEQRIKNLRGENSEDLIFNGSSSKKPLGMTEVGAFFVNNGEEIYIARRFFRSSESKYILNEKYCRNKDIQDELFKINLSEKKYFIFEQGSIEKLISLKPTEKRILIDESAGISQYLERKKETANKLIIAEQNLENIGILISDKKNRLRELKNQVNFVHRYKNVKNNKINFQKTLLKKQSAHFQKDFKKYKSEIERLTNIDAIQTTEISQIEKKLFNGEEKRWKLDKDLKNNQKDVFDLNRDILSNTNDIEKSLQRRDFLNHKVIEINNTIETNEKEVLDIDDKIELEKTDIKKLETELKSKKAIHKKLGTELSKQKEELISIHSKEADLKKNFFNTQSEISQVTNEILNTEKRLTKTENEILTKQNFMTELKNQISDSDIKAAENNFTNMNNVYEKKSSAFQTIENDLKKIQSHVEELNKNVKNIENELKNLGSQKEKYLEIKTKIMGHPEEIKEIHHHGYLQDLIKADNKHYPILENFYYDEMDSILPKNNDDVLKSDFYKFLLNKNQHPIPPEVKKEEGFIAEVKDLFELKDQNIKKNLKNGVVVDNLKNGINIFVTYGINIVTRDAETINRHGLLIRNREKGILDVIGEIKKIDNNIKKQTETFKKTGEILSGEKEKFLKLEKNIEAKRSELKESEENLIRTKTNWETLDKNREVNLKRVEMNKSEIQLLTMENKKIKDELKILADKKNELEKETTRLSKKRETLQNDIKSLNEQINGVEKDFFQNENSINLLEEKSNSINNNINGLNSHKSKLLNNSRSSQIESEKLKNEVTDILARVEHLKNNGKTFTQKKNDLEKTIKKQEQEFQLLNAEIKKDSDTLNTNRKHLEKIKEEKNHVEINYSSIKKDLNQLEETAYKELNTDLANINGIDELMGFDISDLERELETNNEKLIRMRDSNRLNLSAESEYEILNKETNFLSTQKEDVVQSIQNMNSAIKKIDEESKESFLNAYNKIRENFIKNFQILFEGGEAELILSEAENNIFESGLEIKAQPPGKRLQSLRLLSGGEKALTSLAFLFSLFEYKPSPFCVFDEVDASLDDANIDKFLKFVKKLKEKTQFLIITHNFRTMEQADYIYGISMNEPGISTLYSMKMTGKNKLQTQ